MHVADIDTICRKPDLVVMDVIRILTTTDSKGLEAEDIGEVVTSLDIVAADAYAAALFKHPKTGSRLNQTMSSEERLELGFGEIDLSKVRVEKDERDVTSDSFL